MDLIAYWHPDNYWPDLERGAGFHYNSRQPALHNRIKIGEKLWLFTKVAGATGQTEYRLAAMLMVAAKTINRPGYKYGPYRLVGDPNRSKYYRVDNQDRNDLYELIRLLPLDTGNAEGSSRHNLPQRFQSIRGVTPEGSASALLEKFAEHLAPEPRARAVLDERILEMAVYLGQKRLQSVLRESSAQYSDARTGELMAAARDRSLVGELRRLYGDKCQLCGFDGRVVYGVKASEAHYIVYLSRGGDDSLENMLLLCPNHHTIVHKTSAPFDYSTLAFAFPNGRVEPLAINKHIEPTVL